jgi:hypothetical protein
LSKYCITLLTIYSPAHRGPVTSNVVDRRKYSDTAGVPDSSHLIPALVRGAYYNKKKGSHAQNTILHLFLYGLSKQVKVFGESSVDVDWVIKLCTSLIEAYGKPKPRIIYPKTKLGRAAEREDRKLAHAPKRKVKPVVEKKE